MEETLRRLIKFMNRIAFPGIFGESNPESDKLCVESIIIGLSDRGKTDIFMSRIPEICRLLNTDVDAVMHNAPAVTSREEIIVCYPAIKEMVHYRTAHELLALGIHTVPRMLTEMAHSATGIDIHPAAEIGEYFGIDHGTGIVVGATR